MHEITLAHVTSNTLNVNLNFNNAKYAKCLYGKYTVYFLGKKYYMKQDSFCNAKNLANID